MTFGLQYLHHSALFPQRYSGERWGDHSLLLHIAGGPFRIDGLSELQVEGLRLRYDDLIDERDQPDAFEISLFRAPLSDFITLDTRGWEYSLDIERQPQSLAIAGINLMARADLNGRRAALWTPIEKADEVWGVIENLLRPLVAYSLLERGGLLIHSAAVYIEPNALLFAGPSGAGKSTISRLALAAGHGVLSDDLNALRLNGGGAVLEPLPFTGDLLHHEVVRRSATARALVRLKHGASEEVNSMHRAEAVALVVKSAPYVNADPFRTTQLLETAAMIVGRMKTAELTFRREGDVWPILRALHMT